MRTTKVIILTLLIFGVSGCSSLPKPSSQRIVLHGTVDFNESQIRPDSLPLLDEAAATLKGHNDLRIIVTGHADSTGSDEANWKLSQRRAQQVRDYLIAHGVTDYQIMVVGKGASKPVASNDTPEGRAQNRRVEIEVHEMK